MTVKEYVARAALWNLTERGQGDRVLDDAVWDIVVTPQEATAWLESIRSLLIGLGISTDDSDLEDLMRIGKSEIEEHYF